MKKFASLLLALVIVLSLAMPAFALDVDSKANGNCSITISNASKGETYSVYKLFDATITGKENGSIYYTGTIPESLKTYFTEADGYITVTDNAKEFSSAAVNAMAAWADTASDAKVISEDADGTTLKFTGLQPGLYVVTTTQGAAVTVDSTNPNATVIDKNSTTVRVFKSVDDNDVYIGQKVNYTVKFPTTNWITVETQTENNTTQTTIEQVSKYEITDTLPSFLTNVKVNKIYIDNDGILTADSQNDQTQLTVSQFDTNKKITIDWVDGTTSKYDNGVYIVIEYEANVSANAQIDGAGNKNEVTLDVYTVNREPSVKTLKDDAVIWTYAAALKKVDENQDPLAGAKFAAKGLTVTGSDGKYTVTGYDATSTANGTVMETDDQGNLVILGLQSDKTNVTNEDGSTSTAPTFKLVLTETEAPAGYNKLVETVELPTSIINEYVTAETKTIYYDAEGKVTETVTERFEQVTTYNEKLKALAIEIKNEKGLELPSTGGMGTTLFYIVGAGLMLAAAVLLVTKKRMSNN